MRDGYKEGIPSVTELIEAGRRLLNLPPLYPHDPSGYYFKRGHFVDQCASILAAGKELDDRTQALAHQPRLKPLADQFEHWDDYIRPFRNYVSEHEVKLIEAQMYVMNPFDSYQGTLDLLWTVDGELTLDDIKCGDCPKTTALQTAGYDMARCTKDRARRRGLQLEPGKLTIHEYNDHRDYDRFRNLVRTYWGMGEYR